MQLQQALCLLNSQRQVVVRALIVTNFVAYFHERSLSQRGRGVQHCALDYEWREPEAIQWATRKLLELKGRFSEHFELDLDAKYAPLLGVTLAAGLGIDSVILIGEPEQALSSVARVHTEDRSSPRGYARGDTPGERKKSWQAEGRPKGGVKNGKLTHQHMRVRAATGEIAEPT